MKAVDGHGLSMKDYYFDRSTDNFERRDSPPEHVSSSEKKIGSREHKLKFPEKYVSTYTSSLEQAAFPIPGTAPSEVAAAKKIVNQNGPVKYDKNGLPNKASPQQVDRAAENIERMRQMTGKPNQPKIKKINAYSEVKIPIPTIKYSLLRNSAADKAKAAEIEKLRVHAFTSRADDTTKGIGSLTNSTVKKLKAADWLRGNQTTYKR